MTLRSVANNLRPDTPIVSANLRRKPPLIVRRAGYDCAPLQVSGFSLFAAHSAKAGLEAGPLSFAPRSGHHRSNLE